MIPEIWSAADRSFSHLGLFLPFYPSPLPPPPLINNSKNQNFEKMKKNPRDIIILLMYTINDNHLIYGS